MCEIMPSIYKKTTPARACRCPVIETDLSRCLYISTQRVSHPITRFIPREPRPYPPTNLLIPVDESENHEGIPFQIPSYDVSACPNAPTAASDFIFLAQKVEQIGNLVKWPDERQILPGITGRKARFILRDFAWRQSRRDSGGYEIYTRIQDWLQLG